MLTKAQIFGMYLGGEKTNGLTTKIFNDIRWSIDMNDYIVNGLTLRDCKLILRTYEDMTEKEIKMFYKLHDDIHCGYDAQHTEYLISIGIDVFNAIGKGWAVRKGEGNETE